MQKSSNNPIFFTAMRIIELFVVFDMEKISPSIKL